MKKPASKPKVRSTASVAPSVSMADEKRWKTEDAMRTLMRAEDLKKDKGLMRDVQKMASEQAKKMSGLCGKTK